MEETEHTKNDSIIALPFRVFRFFRGLLFGHCWAWLLTGVYTQVTISIREMSRRRQNRDYGETFPAGRNSQ